MDGRVCTNGGRGRGGRLAAVRRRGKRQEFFFFFLSPMRDLRQDIGPRTGARARRERRRDRRPQFHRPSFLDFVSLPDLPVRESARAAGCPRARAKNAAVRAGCCCQQRLTRAPEGPTRSSFLPRRRLHVPNARNTQSPLPSHSPRCRTDAAIASASRPHGSFVSTRNHRFRCSDLFRNRWRRCTDRARTRTLFERYLCSRVEMLTLIKGMPARATVPAHISQFGDCLAVRHP